MGKKIQPTSNINTKLKEKSLCHYFMSDKGQIDSYNHLFCFECIKKWS